MERGGGCLGFGVWCLGFRVVHLGLRVPLTTAVSVEWLQLSNWYGIIS